MLTDWHHCHKKCKHITLLKTTYYIFIFEIKKLCSSKCYSKAVTADDCSIRQAGFLPLNGWKNTLRWWILAIETAKIIRIINDGKLKCPLSAADMLVGLEWMMDSKVLNEVRGQPLIYHVSKPLNAYLFTSRNTLLHTRMLFIWIVLCQLLSFRNMPNGKCLYDLKK